MSHVDPAHDPGRYLPSEPGSGLLHVYVECARGAVVKDKFDVAAGGLRFHKHMPRGMAWPFAYGFVCGTRGPDGDPLDAVVLSARAIEPGRVLAGRLIGAIEAVQTVEAIPCRNDRFIVADPTCAEFGQARSLADVETAVAGVERFFVEYNTAQGRTFRVLGRLDAPAAMRALVNSPRG